MSSLYFLSGRSFAWGETSVQYFRELYRFAPLYFFAETHVSELLVLRASCGRSRSVMVLYPLALSQLASNQGTFLRSQNSFKVTTCWWKTGTKYLFDFSPWSFHRQGYDTELRTYIVRLTAPSHLQLRRQANFASVFVLDVYIQN